MKKVYIEWLRIIAVIFVIYNHTKEYGYDLYLYTDDTISYWLSIIMIPICKTAVPVFLMIAGVNLLGKEENYKKLFIKRISKYCIVILLFGTLQYFRYVRVGKVTLSLTAWFSSIYCKPILETYWYLYVYLGFLLILPMIRKAIPKMSKKEYIYLFLLNSIYGILCVIGYFTGYFINGNVFVLQSIFVYPLLGYGMDYFVEDTKKNLIILGFLTFMSLNAVIVISVVYFNITSSAEAFINLIQTFTPVISCGIFGIVKIVCKNHANSMTFNKFALMVGSATFGIYLIEDIVRNQIIKILMYINITVNDFLIALFYTLFTFISSTIIILMIKKIPVIKKLL